nr:pro-resilin-like [Procambarus clarkii]
MASKKHLTLDQQMLVLAVLVGAAHALPEAPAPYGAPAGPASYNFNYAVKDAGGNDFGHSERRNGYNTQGSYHVQLPDGRLQNVAYTVNGDAGYVAQVGYQGEASYPAYHPAPRPAPSYGTSPAYGK